MPLVVPMSGQQRGQEGLGLAEAQNPQNQPVREATPEPTLPRAAEGRIEPISPPIMSILPYRTLIHAYRIGFFGSDASARMRPIPAFASEMSW